MGVTLKGLVADFKGHFGAVNGMAYDQQFEVVRDAVDRGVVDGVSTEFLDSVNASPIGKQNLKDLLSENIPQDSKVRMSPNDFVEKVGGVLAQNASVLATVAGLNK